MLQTSSPWGHFCSELESQPVRLNDTLNPSLKSRFSSLIKGELTFSCFLILMVKRAPWGHILNSMEHIFPQIRCWFPILINLQKYLSDWSDFQHSLWQEYRWRVRQPQHTQKNLVIWLHESFWKCFICGNNQRESPVHPKIERVYRWKADILSPTPKDFQHETHGHPHCLTQMTRAHTWSCCCT